MSHEKPTFGPNFGLGGRVKVQVINSKTKEPVPFDYKGERVMETPWKHNLVLNNWMEKMASVQANWFTAEDSSNAYCGYCYAGTGSTDNKTDGGAVTASQSGVTITLSAPVAAMSVGRVIAWDTGESSTLIAGSGTSWTTHAVRSKTVAAGTFTVHHTEEDSLVAHHRKSSFVSATYTTFNAASGEATATGTYEFGAEGSSVIINELGFGNGRSIEVDHGTNLFSRVKLDGGVTLLEGEQLRVTYVLTFRVGPLTDQTSSMVISGWTTGTITERCVGLEQCLNLDADTDWAGALHPLGEAGFNENRNIMRLHTRSTIPAVASTIGAQSGILTGGGEPNSSYVGAGSYAYDKTYTFGPTDSNSSAVRGICIADSFNQPGYMCLFANTVEKADTHKLTITFRIVINPEYDNT